MAATGAEAGTTQIQICGGDGRHRRPDPQPLPQAADGTEGVEAGRSRRRRRSGSAALATCSRRTTQKGRTASPDPRPADDTGTGRQRREGEKPTATAAEYGGWREPRRWQRRKGKRPVATAAEDARRQAGWLAAMGGRRSNGATAPKKWIRAGFRRKP
jgi:hypothetical protein